ncbi:ribonuclease H-like domain-containing protein [Patescibacteria group bacterium]|nr:ribonuclease H-like domain-containing protein [Patescibacteria group bacterium]MBU4579507.1 ribonuclease H-like domain-containing protein [Patescibacteria group bacterium]
MNRLVFDIETAGMDFEKLDKNSREYLLKNSETDEEKKEIKSKLGLWPLTAQIVAIAVLNPDTDKGAVYYQAGNEDKKTFTEEGIEYHAGAEAEIISLFWKAAEMYDQFITFNGRGFDAPFLIIRSAINKIIPTRNLMPPRFSSYAHVDLMDQLTFYGATKRSFSLDFYAKSFGIKSPKDNGVNGAEVGALFKNKEYEKIARYCMGDVVATKKLYEIWRDYINIA